MHNSKAAWFRVIIFIILLFMINYTLIFVFVPKGGNARMTMREMYSQKENIDVAFIGASLSERDVYPYIMDKKLGVKTFDYAFPSQMFVGTYYSLKELFDYQKPKLIILTAEQLNFTIKEEKTLAYTSTAPYMKSFINQIEYYFMSSALDGAYLDRLFPWRGYHVNSVQALMKNFHEKLDKSYINYPEPGQVEDFEKNKTGYIGNGAIKLNPNDPNGTINYNNLKVSRTNRNISEIQGKNVEYLKKISELCKENNCELILLNPPAPVYQVLRVNNYFDFNNEIAKIAKDLNIEYYDYSLIKSELFKLNENYFCDGEHLNSTGAKAFSESFADFLKLRQNGEDMGKYFYTPEEYKASINYIANTWFNFTKDGGKIKLTADSTHGTKVTPEYQFVLTDLETGEQKIIRDYDKSPTFIFDSSEYKKYKIRVNARVNGASDDKLTRYYEEEISK
ncbi:lipolytic protein G-D-S-L family [Clostridium sp. DL-VIII]|uniref:SGNH/GDSL hydrolase family protein n=1 Tax=Clostridium sp. DL-VIII TaxID=641107 RepID=UPI00023B0728|nr:SGNH/GDSL hydrolase family protein [Clostridium sp. DL-VIII]EHJ02121.1 lipolytic protein G-D-S-L family [Clostridium sp. DL-VIII]